MSAIRRRMHRITLILYTGLTIYYILYTILYYLLASLYTTLYILYCIIYWPHYILYSILYCIIYWPHCPAEDVVVFFGIISGFYVHQQNRTNFPLRCPFLLFSLSSLLFPFWWFCNGIRRIAQIGHWAVDPGALLRSKCTKPRFSVYCPLKNPVDPLSFNSIGTQCTLDYLKYVFFYILF